jgi:hypothetical protein
MMIDEDKVIDAIRQEYTIGMLNFTPGLETLLRSVYRAGYKQREIEEMQERLKSLTGDDNGTNAVV